MTLDYGDRDYWKGVDLGDEFDQCKEEINEAIEDFTKGAIYYFLESPSNESDKPFIFTLFIFIHFSSGHRPCHNNYYF